MLSRSDIERLAPTVTHGNAGHAETLYLQDIVLSTVSRETSDELVFKGGTALMKFFQLDRFSTDLDFTGRTDIDLPRVVDGAVRDLENYGATVAERTDESSDTGATARLGIQGPLYTGERRTLCFLRLEVNTAATVVHADIRRYTPQFPDIPAFDLLVLDEAEILAEKMRALLTRSQPRDLYDIYHLLEKGVQPDTDLIQAKLDYYGIEYGFEQAISAARELEGSWETLEPLVYGRLPPFETVLATLTEELNGRN